MMDGWGMFLIVMIIYVVCVAMELYDKHKRRNRW